MESFMQVFSLVKECCKEDLNEIAYKCWISPIEPYRMDDNTAILLVKRKLFQTNYRKTICRTAERSLYKGIWI